MLASSTQTFVYYKKLTFKIYITFCRSCHQLTVNQIISKEKGLKFAIVGLVKAIACKFETDLVEAAVFLNIKANLLELAKGIEDLEEVLAVKEQIEIYVVLIGALLRAFNGKSLIFVLVEAHTIALGEYAEECYVILYMKLLELDLAVTLNVVEGGVLGCKRHKDGK
jgi:hypothetical protein